MSKQVSTRMRRVAVMASALAAVGALNMGKAMAGPQPQPSNPEFTVDNAVAVTEGNAGNTLMKFTIHKSKVVDYPTWVKVSTKQFGYAAASSASDYVGLANLQVNFPAYSQADQVVNVQIKGDTMDEYDETLALEIQSTSPNSSVADGFGFGYINDDDAAPGISINDIHPNEGTGSNTKVAFTVSLSAPSGKLVKVNAQGFSGTANVPNDVEAPMQVLSLNAGATKVSYTVSVVGDSIPEANETFSVQLTNVQNASYVDSYGLGTIMNDDYYKLPIPSQPKDPQQPGDPGGNSGLGTPDTHTGDAGLGIPDTHTGDGGLGIPDTHDGGQVAVGDPDIKPVSHSFNWMPAALFVALLMCLVAIVEAIVILNRRRNNQ